MQWLTQFAKHFSLNPKGMNAMWADVETKNDFLNFKVMAGLVAQMVLDAGGKPLSIGISGGWGVGKSSMIKLIEEELQTANERRIVTLTFNPWLYQGQDDAKAALMEEISRILMGCAKENQPLLKQGGGSCSKGQLVPCTPDGRRDRSQSRHGVSHGGAL